MKKFSVKILALVFTAFITAISFTACDFQSIVNKLLDNSDTPTHVHIFDDGKITLPALCEHDGEMTFTCIDCDYSYTEVIPATGHTEGDAVVENAEDSLCEIGGSYDSVIYCVVCGKELSRETYTDAPAGHIPANAVKENEKPATCTEDGGYDNVVYCAVCGEELSRETVITQKVPHDFNDWEIVKKATAAEDGERRRTCNICGKTETEVIPALGVFIPLEQEDYYAYNYLKTAENSATLLYTYNKLADGAENMQETIILNGEGYSVTKDLFDIAYHCYKADYPQHFWVDNGYYYSISGDKVHTVSLKYSVEKSQLATLKSQVEAKKNKLFEDISPRIGETEVETELHNRLILANTYDTTLKASHTHDLYGALVNGTSVCDGYTKAFQYLLYCAGIQCVTVSGVGLSGESYENHAWNVVRLNGDYYCVDATWDDPTFADGRKDYVGHDYHNVTTETLSKDHFLWKRLEGGVIKDGEIYFTVPTCTATAANYFNYFGYVAEELTIENCRTVLTKEVKNGVTKNYSIYFTCGNLTDAKVSSFISNNSIAFRKMMRDVFGVNSLPLYNVDGSGHIVTFIP